MGVGGNLDLLRDMHKKQELAGRTGWWKLWDENGDDYWGSLHIMLSLMPTVVLIFCSFWLSIALWR